MSIRDQLTFGGTSNCDKFEPNPFLKTASKCKNCLCPLTAHKSEAVTDDDIELHIKVVGGKEGTEILQHVGGGFLYLGGTGACSPNFIKKKNITKVVNAAGGLYAFQPKFGMQVQEMRDQGVITVLELNWLDTESQQLWRDEPWDQLEEAVMFVEENLANGEHVSVHCAQGKSRSTTVIAAYLMSKHGMSRDESLTFCQEKRPVADPNNHFKAQLLDFEKSEKLIELRERLSE